MVDLMTLSRPGPGGGGGGGSSRILNPMIPRESGSFSLRCSNTYTFVLSYVNTWHKVSYNRVALGNNYSNSSKHV